MLSRVEMPSGGSAVGVPSGGAQDIAVRADGLVKRYGAVPALAGLSVELPARTLTVLTGPNGSGKTTFLRMVATLERADKGRLEVLGVDVARGGPALRARVGMVAHSPLLYPALGPRQNLRYSAALHGASMRDADLQAALARVGLSRVAERPVRTLSHGTVRRLSIARALLHRPSLVLMDEPYSGLDEEASRALDALLDELVAAGRTVIVATHEPARLVGPTRLVVELADGKVRSIGGALPASPPAGAATADGTLATMPTFFGAAAAIARKDIAIELRAREAVPLAITFALLVTVLFRFALPDTGAADPALGPGVGLLPGVFWVALVFGSTLGLGRASAAEQEAGGATAMLLSPADRGALFVGKWLGGLAFTLLVAAALIPASVVFLGVPSIPVVPLVGVVGLGAIGWVAAATLVGAMASAARAREALAPVLLYPIAVPLLIAAIQATALSVSGEVERLGAALAIMAAYDVAFVVLGFLAYSAVLEG